MSDELVPLIDTHVHFWDHSLPDMSWGWLRPGFTQGTRVEQFDIDRPRYTAAEFREETAGLGVAGCVHVQCAEPMPDPSIETTWLSEMADAEGLPLAIVGACKMRGEEAPAQLRKHAEHERFRGIRDLWFSSKATLDQLAPALDVCAELDLSLEPSLRSEHAPLLRSIADRWPTVTMLVSHAGIPKVRTEATRKQWQSELELMAGAPNYMCKISAVASRTEPDWTIQSIRPWFFGCIEAFGIERCTLGLNWPYDRPVTTYTRLVEAYRELTSELTLDEQHALYHGNAERIYRLPPVA